MISVSVGGYLYIKAIKAFKRLPFLHFCCKIINEQIYALSAVYCGGNADKKRGLIR